MKAQIVTTGFDTRSLSDGLPVIRVNFYHEPGEPGYEEHHVQVLDELGNPTGEWRDNPALNHFMRVSHEDTPQTIREKVRALIVQLKQIRARQAQLNAWVGTEITEK